MIDLILDTAGQKGTGKWTVISACDLGVPLTLIAEAVFARCLSAQKDERVAASKILKGPAKPVGPRPVGAGRRVEHALYASKIISYAQGYALMDAMVRESKWEINRGPSRSCGGAAASSAARSSARSRRPSIAIRSSPISYSTLTSVARSIAARLAGARPSAAAIAGGIPLPAMTSALAYYDGYRSERLPANLLQAQRDYFGAHTYERVDQPAREVLPHQLDRPGRDHRVILIQRLKSPRRTDTVASRVTSWPRLCMEQSAKPRATRPLPCSGPPHDPGLRPDRCLREHPKPLRLMNFRRIPTGMVDFPAV